MARFSSDYPANENWQGSVKLVHGLSKFYVLLSLKQLTGTFLDSGPGLALGNVFSWPRGWCSSVLKDLCLFSQLVETERAMAGSVGVEEMNLVLLQHFLPSTSDLTRFGVFVKEACVLEPQRDGGRWGLAGETDQK